MSIKKIPCGGWLYDDEQITFEDGVMKVIGGGFNPFIINLSEDPNNVGHFIADKSSEELMSAYLNGEYIIGHAILSTDSIWLDFNVNSLTFFKMMYGSGGDYIYTPIAIEYSPESEAWVMTNIPDFYSAEEPE